MPLENLSYLLVLIDRIWPSLLGFSLVLLQLIASSHAILNKRDPRAAVGWVGLIWLSPALGALLYYIFGINRIRARAALLKGRFRLPGRRASRSPPPADLTTLTRRDTPLNLDSVACDLSNLARYVGTIVDKPLTSGNKIVPLINGEQAYPAMLQAIEAARISITLSTYIFDNDKAGGDFVSFLSEAVKRGVKVRVLYDDVGARYSFPSIQGRLKRARVPNARFLPTVLPWRWPYMNLRNHRKLMVVDGKIGFTGGMNIRQGHLVEQAERRGIQDLHFKIEGPVVGQLQEIFAKDWMFATREQLQGEDWFPTIGDAGPSPARGIADGPDEDFEEIRWTIFGAIAMARRSIRIMTPYFLPDSTMATFLNVAAMSGVRVEVLIPERSNLLMVQWASMALLSQLLQRGCRVFLSKPPFDHSKLMIVDGSWVLFGSSNWDTRSMRLNFEFNVETYDHHFASQVGAIFEEKKSTARELTLFDLNSRSLPVRLRDGVAWLFSPYL